MGLRWMAAWILSRNNTLSSEKDTSSQKLPSYHSTWPIYSRIPSPVLWAARIGSGLLAGVSVDSARGSQMAKKKSVDAADVEAAPTATPEGKSLNRRLGAAKAAKQDEFYTQYV